MKALVAVTKALADANRVRALAAVLDRELCVCQITELLGLAPSTVSKHLSILKQAGLLVSRKEGRWIHYRLPRGRLPEPVAGALRWLRRVAEADPDWGQDRRRLAAILRQDPETLCRKQCRRC